MNPAGIQSWFEVGVGSKSIAILEYMLELRVRQFQTLPTSHMKRVFGTNRHNISDCAWPNG